MDKENKNFESLLEDIKKTINKLENENIEIDEAIVLFENGIKQINLANDKISDIKNRVVKIVKDNKITHSDNNAER